MGADSDGRIKIDYPGILHFPVHLWEQHSLRLEPTPMAGSSWDCARGHYSGRSDIATAFHVFLL